MLYNKYVVDCAGGEDSRKLGQVWDKLQDNKVRGQDRTLTMTLTLSSRRLKYSGCEYAMPTLFTAITDVGKLEDSV